MVIRLLVALLLQKYSSVRHVIGGYVKEAMCLSWFDVPPSWCCTKKLLTYAWKVRDCLSPRAGRSGKTIGGNTLGLGFYGYKRPADSVLPYSFTLLHFTS